MDEKLPRAAVRLAEEIAAKNVGPLVLAESCTGGMAAAAIVGIAGASNWFCGSSVVYRPASKRNWLGISSELIETFSTESIEATTAMCGGILERTPEAKFAAAITGHLEEDDARELPHAHAFVACCARDASSVCRGPLRLTASDRAGRQAEAASLLLHHVTDVIQKSSRSRKISDDALKD